MEETSLRVCRAIPGQSVINGDETIEKSTLIECLERKATPGLSKVFGVIPIADDLQQCLAERYRIPGWDQESRLFVLHILRETSGRAGHDGCAPHHRFSGRVSECLRATRRNDLYPSRIETAFNNLAWLMTEKVDFSAKLFGEAPQSRTLRTLPGNE
jgi:hypothetical protein